MSLSLGWRKSGWGRGLSPSPVAVTRRYRVSRVFLGFLFFSFDYFFLHGLRPLNATTEVQSLETSCVLGEAFELELTRKASNGICQQEQRTLIFDDFTGQLGVPAILVPTNFPIPRSTVSTASSARRVTPPLRHESPSSYSSTRNVTIPLERHRGSDVRSCDIRVQRAQNGCIPQIPRVHVRTGR